MLRTSRVSCRNGNVADVAFRSCWNLKAHWVDLN